MNSVSGDALTALVARWRANADYIRSVSQPNPVKLAGADTQEFCANELAAVLNAQLDTAIAHDWEVFEAGRQHGLAHGPSVPPPAPKAPVA